MSVHVKAGGKHAPLSGDASHHPLQMKHLYLPVAADFDQALAQTTRHKIPNDYAVTSTLLLTAHFPSPTAGRIIGCKDSFGFVFRED